MPKFIKWFWALNKRLYKKASFAAMLVLLLVFVLVFSFMAGKHTGGFAHIVLVAEDSGAVSSEIISELLKENSLLRFTTVSSAKQAADMVKTGGADSAWIFKSATDKKISDFLSGDTVTAVEVIEREQNVLLRLSREKLYAKLFEHTATTFFVAYGREKTDYFDDITDEQLLYYFENTAINKNLFILEQNTNSTAGEIINNNYLLTPLRGILSIVCVFGGLASALYCLQDAQHGTFAMLSQKKRFWVDFAGVAAATLNLSVVMLIALCASRMYKFGLREAAATVCFTLCSAAFAMFVKSLLKSITIIGSLLPVLAILMTIICPVFLTVAAARYIAPIFPPTYYLLVVSNAKYLIYMLGYAVIFTLAAYLLSLRQHNSH